MKVEPPNPDFAGPQKRPRDMEDPVVQHALKALVDILDNTRPRRVNIRAWNEIRTVSGSSRSSLQAGDPDKVLNEVVTVLGNTTPENANTVEWQAIREVCAAQLKSTASTKAKLVAVLTQLSRTTPRQNTLEWAAIRAVCAVQLQRLAEAS
jgi:hypothetical protein